MGVIGSSNSTAIKGFIGDFWKTAQVNTETMPGGRQKTPHSHMKNQVRINTKAKKKVVRFTRDVKK